VTPVLGNRRQREPIRCFNQEISGRIVVDTALAADESVLDDLIRTKELEVIETGSDGGRCLIVPHLFLYGIEFDNYYYGEHRGQWSFVFLESPDLLPLSGRLVSPRYVKDAEEQSIIKIWGPKAHEDADWGIKKPHTDFLSYWDQLLLAWVKCFFISDLSLKASPGWDCEMRGDLDSDKSQIGGLCRQYGLGFVKKGMWDYLMETY
jgi:hypothetical protein